MQTQLRATATTAVVAVVANLAIWALTHALVDVPDRFTPLRAGGVVFLTIIGVLLAAGVLRVLAARSQRPVKTFRRIVPIALAISLIPDVAIWVSGAYDGAAEAQTVLPLMAMHVVAAAACWLILPLPLQRAHGRRDPASRVSGKRAGIDSSSPLVREEDAS